MAGKRFVLVIVSLSLCLGLLFAVDAAHGEAIIADHIAVTQFDSIPMSVVEAIGDNYHIYYVHTSHGSQIMTGINEVKAENSLYDPPYFYERSDDLGHNGDTTWVPYTRYYLDNHPECNMAMFSWCGGCSDNTEEGINIYLAKMEELEDDYPDVIFIYMTGHLDGSGTGGNLYARNNQIRAYCVDSSKILFDFADIESYDPDGTYYPDESDGCGWCYDWCSTHTCPSCACAHSHCFNCYLKGKGWWWMMARIEGWSPDQDSIPSIVSTLPAQNELNVDTNATISVIFDLDMDSTTINNSTFVVNARSTGLHQGTFDYDSLSKTVTFDPEEDFDVGEVITVVLTTGIESSAAVTLDSSYIWSFTIEVSDESFGTFALDSSYQVADYPVSVCAADLDGDGDHDLATVGQDDSEVSILLNNGNGSFLAGSTYSVFVWPYDICAGDLDADGDIDLATTIMISEYVCFITVLSNHGDATFTKSTYSGGGGDGSIFAADLNGDGYLDLAATSMMFDEVSVLINDGTGAFPSASLYPVGDGPHSVFAADLDGDADLDLITANFYTNTVSILFNNGDGTFAPASDHIVSDHPYSVFTADLDDDGDIDLASTSEDGEYQGYISVLLNNGDGSFAPFVSYHVGLSAHSLFAADLDGDTTLDLTIGRNFGELVRVLFNNGDGTFANQAEYPTGESPVSIFTADLNGDGYLDLATANTDSNSVSILLNQLINLCGDLDHNGVVEVSDVVFLVEYIFIPGSPAPDPIEIGDVDCNEVVEISDAVYLINYIFNDGPDPCADC